MPRGEIGPQFPFVCLRVCPKVFHNCRERGATDGTDAGIVTKVFKECIAEGEERWIGQAIVLQDDALGFLAEEPIDGPPWTTAWASVDVTGLQGDFARPVHGGRDVTDLCHCLGLTWSIASRVD